VNINRYLVPGIYKLLNGSGGLENSIGRTGRRRSNGLFSRSGLLSADESSKTARSVSIVESTQSEVYRATESRNLNAETSKIGSKENVRELFDQKSSVDVRTLK
jgi:hypothetical protein